MKAIIKREWKNYLRNPVFWACLVVVLVGVYQILEPYLRIHYFESDEEIRNIKITSIADADAMDGYIPSSPQQQKELGIEKILPDMQEVLELSREETEQIYQEIKDMDIKEIDKYMEKYGYYGARYVFEEFAYHQGTAREVNQYLKERMEEHTFSYYFSRKFADFAGLYMAFFSTVLFAFLFLQDTRKNTYELLHTKPVKAWQYILGKIAGGFGVVLLVLGILNIVFIILCKICAQKSGFPVNPLDFLYATAVYILPNMLMIICVYAGISLLFKNPLPAVPLLFLYIVYSNMGNRDAEGNYGYFGRPLAIMVRFPGAFFDTAPPPMVLLNQTFLVFASAALMVLVISIWKRRRVY